MLRATVSSPRIGPLFVLFPFLRPYAGRWTLAFLALVTSAGATLALPLAFRNLIDRGFAGGDRTHIDRYFLALFVVSLVLAGATALRFYLVSWLGERVTADLRRAVYSHVMGMSPQFFETTQTGEVLSRLTTDTTLIQAVVGTSLSTGLRNVFLLTGGVVHAPAMAAAAGFISELPQGYDTFLGEPLRQTAERGTMHDQVDPA